MVIRKHTPPSPAALAALIAAALLLTSCGLYESPQPLAPPEEGFVDERLTGRWECLSFPDPDEPGMIAIKPLEGASPYMRVAIEGADREILGFTSRLNGETIFNATEDFKKWGLFHYWFVHKDLFELRPIGKKTLPEQPPPREELGRLIGPRLHDETLYDETCIACWRDTSIDYPGWLEDMMEFH